MLQGDEMSHLRRPPGDGLFSIFTPTISAPGAAPHCPRASVVQTIKQCRREALMEKGVKN